MPRRNVLYRSINSVEYEGFRKKEACVLIGLGFKLHNFRVCLQVLARGLRERVSEAEAERDRFRAELELERQVRSTTLSVSFRREK